MLGSVTLRVVYIETFSSDVFITDKTTVLYLLIEEP